MVSHYDVLQVPSSASLADIKAAYHALALELHPDKQQPHKEGQHVLSEAERLDQTQRYHLVQVAWEVRSNFACTHRLIQ